MAIFLCPFRSSSVGCASPDPYSHRHVLHLRYFPRRYSRCWGPPPSCLALQGKLIAYATGTEEYAKESFVQHHCRASLCLYFSSSLLLVLVLVLGAALDLDQIRLLDSLLRCREPLPPRVKIVPAAVERRGRKR